MADFYLYNEWISSKMRLLKDSNQNEEWNLQEMAKVTPTWRLKLMRLHAGLKLVDLKICCTVQPHYNAPHYSAVFNITRPCHGSQINYFAICLL